MKKTYNHPTTIVVNIKCVSMMALSTLGKSAKTTGADNGFMESRQDNSWDIWGTDDDFED